MKKYNRIFVIVLDSLGIGAMPDSERFGDTDVDTFGHILERMQTLDIPNLTRLGIKDTFGKSGKAEELMKYFGIDKDSIIEAVIKYKNVNFM